MSHVCFTTREIREKYDHFARWFDLAEGIPLTLLGIQRLRRRWFAQARGRVLEVAAGTGINLASYPAECELVLSDLSRAMLERARRRARRRDRRAVFLEVAAERLPFRSHTFDTVTSSLGLCTFPDPETALREFGRVCRPDGRILLLEHGKSSVGWMARFQDRHAGAHAKALGCNWNREPDRIAERAGLAFRRHERYRFGVFHVLELAP